jgi:hypothetical protein
MDAANRIRIKGTTRIISQELLADNAVLQEKVEACHRGKVLADASLFDSELKISSIKKHLRAFDNYMLQRRGSKNKLCLKLVLLEVKR